MIGAIVGPVGKAPSVVCVTALGINQRAVYRIPKARGCIGIKSRANGRGAKTSHLPCRVRQVHIAEVHLRAKHDIAALNVEPELSAAKHASGVVIVSARAVLTAEPVAPVKFSVMHLVRAPSTANVSAEIEPAPVHAYVWRVLVSAFGRPVHVRCVCRRKSHDARKRQPQNARKYLHPKPRSDRLRFSATRTLGLGFDAMQLKPLRLGIEALAPSVLARSELGFVWKRTRVNFVRPLYYGHTLSGTVSGSEPRAWSSFSALAIKMRSRH